MAFWSRRSHALTPDTLALIDRIVRGDVPERELFDERIRNFVADLRREVGPYWLTIAASVALDVGIQEPGGRTDFVDRYGVEAQIQFLISACADIPHNHDHAPSSAVQAAYDYINEIFELEAAAAYCDFPAETYADRSSRGLVVEAIYDRFESYGRHILEIKEATLNPIQDLLVEHLGWSLDDYWAVADAAAVDSTEKRKATHKALLDDPGAFEAEIRAHGEWETHMSHAAEFRFHRASDLAHIAELEESVVRAILNYLSLDLDGSSLVDSPRTVSPLRTRPVIQLPRDRFFIPFPQLWKQETFRLVNEVTSRSEVLRARWLKARDDGTEALVAKRLSELFGPERVLREVTHTGAAIQGETDVIVDLGDDALLVECKAHTLTAAGRRGAPGRIETKTGEILGKAFDQITKARVHLELGLPISPKGRKSRLVPVTVESELPGLVVSFERIDPMFMHTALREFENPSLAVSLSDFLSITDLLRWPSAFYFYVSERSKLLGLENVRATTEQDFLGMFLEAQQLGLLAAPSQDVDAVWIDGYGPALNRFLAVSAEAFNAPPLKYPPARVLSALRDSLDLTCEGWTLTARNAHNLPSTEWRSLKGMLRRASPRSSKNRVWVSRDSSLTVTVAEVSQVTATGSHLRIGRVGSRSQSESYRT